MRHMRIILLLVFLAFLLVTFSWPVMAKTYRVFSPDKEIEMKIRVGEKIEYALFHKKVELIAHSAISLTVDGKVLGENPRVGKAKRSKVKNTLHPVIRQKSKEIQEYYNQLVLDFSGGYSLVFRVYNEGAAYRFKTAFSKEIQVDAEEVVFNFKEDYTVYFPQEDRFFSHNERTYIKKSLSKIEPGHLGSLPTLVDTGKGIKLLLTESSLKDYPGLWLRGGSNHSLYGKLPGFVLEEKQTRDRDVKVVKYADYLAKTTGSRSFPWRILALSEKDGELITNQMTYLLAPPLALNDVSWIKPGKVAWDWFNYNNIYGVDFEAGLNTATYKYYIDFASKYGLEYIILDEGWYKLGDLFDINPDMDLPELFAYAKKKNVGIILWVVWKTLDDQLEQALDKFQEWGVKGIKVDFMQRDDQWMVNYYYKIAREAAKHHLTVDFHGSYKPAGLRRAYPNVLTREGVRGLEHNKWSELITPEHNLTLPFIRMVAGPMDYTPGAMVNAQKKNFKAIFNRPMSMGTRCHQLALYVVYESPLQMLADNPSNYLKESQCMEFLSRVPTVWDETRVLHAKISEYAALARKSGNTWYVGALNNSEARELELDFSFLEEGNYIIHMYRDGANAHRYGSDYKYTNSKITKDHKLTIKMAPGGGFAAHLTQE